MHNPHAEITSHSGATNQEPRLSTPDPTHTISINNPAPAHENRTLPNNCTTNTTAPQTNRQTDSTQKKTERNELKRHQRVHPKRTPTITPTKGHPQQVKSPMHPHPNQPSMLKASSSCLQINRPRGQPRPSRARVDCESGRNPRTANSQRRRKASRQSMHAGAFAKTTSE